MTPAEREQIERWVRSRTSPQRLVVRSQIVLLAAEGLATGAIARRVHVAPATVRLWCRRFQEGGLAALTRDAPGRGRKAGMSRSVLLAVLRTMLEAPESGRRWTANSLARRVGTSPTTVWRIWRRYNLSPPHTGRDVRRALEQAISETRPRESGT